MWLPALNASVTAGVVAIAAVFLPANAALPLVVTGATPGWADNDKHGFAVELMQAFIAQGSAQIQFQVLPLKRAVAQYVQSQALCFLGGDATSVAEVAPLELVSSRPFRRAGIAIYTLSGAPVVRDLEQARLLRLGLERGVDMRSILKRFPNIQRESAPAEVQLRKMAVGRIDAYVGLFPPARAAAARVGFDHKPLLLSYADTLHCHPGASSSELLAAFDSFLSSYQRSGALRVNFYRHFADGTWIEP